VQVIVEPVKEHRAILVLRGEELRGEIEDTDPNERGSAAGAQGRRAGGGKNGLPGRRNRDPGRKDPGGRAEGQYDSSSGFAKPHRYPSMKERYG